MAPAPDIAQRGTPSGPALEVQLAADPDTPLAAGPTSSAADFIHWLDTVLIPRAPPWLQAMLRDAHGTILLDTLSFGRAAHPVLGGRGSVQTPLPPFHTSVAGSAVSPAADAELCLDIEQADWPAEQHFPDLRLQILLPLATQPRERPDGVLATLGRLLAPIEIPDKTVVILDLVLHSDRVVPAETRLHFSTADGTPCSLGGLSRVRAFELSDDGQLLARSGRRRWPVTGLLLGRSRLPLSLPEFFLALG